MRARALTLLGRDEEAERATRECERVAAPRQLDAQIKWREIRAVALAHQGRLDDAERLAREAVELARHSEQPDSRAQALADLAEVLRLASRPAKAMVLLEQALYLHKGNTVMAERTRRSLAALRSHETI